MRSTSSVSCPSTPGLTSLIVTLWANGGRERRADHPDIAPSAANATGASAAAAGTIAGIITG
jgi:hypothetical protein